MFHINHNDKNLIFSILNLYGFCSITFQVIDTSLTFIMIKKFKDKNYNDNDITFIMIKITNEFYEFKEWWKVT